MYLINTQNGFFILHRHHSLSQWAQACVVCSDDTEQRAKVIAKFVELARALQSSCFGNVFAFFAIMSGLTTSQVTVLIECLVLIDMLIITLGVWTKPNMA